MPSASSDELNRFCSSHQVVSVDKHFVADGQNSFWAMCVVYQSEQAAPGLVRRGKIDYKEVLNETDFAMFAKLRELRKKLAEQQGVPAYALFSNEQLAEMVRRRVLSLSDLAGIEGVGQSRVSKYGQAFLSVIQQVGEDPK